MPCTRSELEARELRFLAPHAQLSSETRGRQYNQVSETQGEFRTHYQRDRDRIIHSRAFRRLEYKTQVFLNGAGDHFRTRLTHTIEVAGIARNIARALRLNEDLAEAVALAHDLGHSPFGHKGEEILNELMHGEGGFEHNVQSLRIVEKLEQKYPEFPGLNLTWEVREGLRKHQQAELGFLSTSLEAQVANLADEIAYYSHDLDDGIEAGLLSENQLKSDVEIWQWADKNVASRYGSLDDECRRYFIIRCIIDEQVRDVVRTTETNIRSYGIKVADDVRRTSDRIVAYSSQRKKANLALRSYLYQNLYYNPKVREPNDHAALFLEHLFEYYLKRPEMIGEGAQKRISSTGLKRTVCDYLAGMTDRYAALEYKKYFT